MIRKRLTIACSAVAACAALFAAPALASNHLVPVPHHAIQALHIPRNSNTELINGSTQPVCQTANYGDQFATDPPTNCNPLGFFYTTYLGNGVQGFPTCWPFSNCEFDNLYAGWTVGEEIQATGAGGCMQTDGVHSATLDNGCGSHNVNTYWVFIEGHVSTLGCGTGGDWMVNVGLTDHENQYPYGSAMFDNTNGLVYTEPNESAADGDDQWCSFTP